VTLLLISYRAELHSSVSDHVGRLYLTSLIAHAR